MIDSVAAETALRCQATLGEGPLWDHREHVLWWVDIESHELHRFDPRKGEDIAFDVGQRVGTVVCRERGGLMLAVESGFAEFDPHNGSLGLVCDPEDKLPSNRFNDGKCDPEGRFWAGTMNLDPDQFRTGGLYSLDSSGAVTKHLSEVGISNGIVWSADARTMFYIDTLERTVDAFDYDRQRGQISNRRPVFNVPESMGYPDGMAIDSDDRLWVAFWGGSCVAQIDPAQGRVLATVTVPAAHVTACAFGGAALDELYITTARSGLDDATLAKQPAAGDLFVARPGATGVPAFTYSG